MSLAVLADHMASKGRNGDTMLVHMTPEEVRGLHALAVAHGGELTINPETGLPEANFLKSFLPTIIGFGISVASGGTIDPMTAALIVGGGETVRTGDIKKGIAAGFGAYGGASFGAGLSTAGEAGLQATTGQEAARVAAEQLALPNTLGQEEAVKYIQQQVAEKAAELSPYEKLMAGAKGVMEPGAGRDAFMSAMGGTKGLMRAGLGVAAPLLAAEDVKAKMPQTVTPTSMITPYAILGGQGGDYSMTGLGSYKPEDFIRLGGFQGLRERVARGELTPPPPPGAAGGGLMGMAEGGVAFESGTTPSYQRTNMSPGMLDFAQRSEPVVRMADGGFTDERVAQALRESMGQGFSLEQSLGGAASKFGISQDQLTRAQALLNPPSPPPPPPSAPAAGLQAAAASIAPPATITSTDPTQQALPTAAQYAEQLRILPDPQAAALAAARSGIAAGMTDQQIANMVNQQYGKTFSAQNVADFMRAQGLTRPTTTQVPFIPVTPAPELFPGTTPGVVSTGEPFTPTVQTMEQVRSDYVKGGGRTDMPTITNIQPTDRTYTYNQAFDLLQGYLKANPNALYGDVVAFARSRGIPDMQAKAAYNEFRFSGLTGGSSQAYDYLMGRGAAPIKPFVPGGGPISRSYAEAMGITGGYQNLKPVNLTATNTGLSGTTPSEKLTTPSGTQLTEAERTALGNTFVQAQQSGNYKGFNAMLQDLRLTVDDMLKLYPALSRSAIQDAIDKGYVKFYEEPISGGASGGLGSMLRAGTLGGGAAEGGHLGSYSDGGRLLRGPGDGVSDSIPAVIGGKRPARLADGEFVVPARIVSEIGNGSTEAGARKLYAMMDRVQAARRKSIGKGKVAKNSRADKYLPA